MINLTDTVHVPRLDSDSGQAIGRVVKLVPFQRDGTPSEFDRIVVVFPNDKVLCWKDEVVKING